MIDPPASQTRPLFIVGNKRSGTSHLVDLLNAHPLVFVAPEADLIWLLYQMSRGTGARPYADDGPAGMRRTLATFGPWLASDQPRDIFFAALARFRRSVAPQKPAPLSWAGDKKPVQQADPELRPFIRKHFPDARYLHIVRHPTAVVGSMYQQARGRLRWMEVWKKSPERLLTFWVRNEHRVEDLRMRSPKSVLTIRYHDLCVDGRRIGQEICRFLEVPVDQRFLDLCEQSSREGANDRYRDFPLRLSEDARTLIKAYDLRL